MIVFHSNGHKNCRIQISKSPSSKLAVTKIYSIFIKSKSFKIFSITWVSFLSISLSILCTRFSYLSWLPYHLWQFLLTNPLLPLLRDPFRLLIQEHLKTPEEVSPATPFHDLHFFQPKEDSTLLLLQIALLVISPFFYSNFLILKCFKIT